MTDMNPKARSKHLARQALHEALKRMRSGGEAWVTFGGKRLRIKPWKLSPSDPDRALVRIGNAVEITDVSTQRYGVTLPRGRYLARLDFDPVIVLEKDVLAWVVEEHERGQAALAGR